MDATQERICLDLGAGDVSPDGFRPMGRPHGSEIFPLPFGDGTVDAIRASHVLEHFPHRQVPAVLADWSRALKPGGELRIAVPDFKLISRQYLEGTPQITEGYVMGGQVDDDDFHKAVFDADKLKVLLAAAGLVLIRPWASELQDCAALPISLNLGGTKPFVAQFGTSAVISLPRVTWTENSKCAFEALPSLRVTLRSVTGAYWGQCLERGIEQALAEDNPDAILTIDYDTVFTRRDVSTLIQLMMCHPEVDAIAPIQAARGKELPLFTIKASADGQNAAGAPRATFAPDLARVSTAHFGLTLIRATALRDLRKPWFHDIPAPDGSWGDGHTDADVAFWRAFEAAGKSLYLANRVAVGHLELMVAWPGDDMRVLHQPLGAWREQGAPQGSWR